MTTVSPLLQTRLNNNANYSLTKKDHEAIYKDLQKHANDVKPNEAKAKLVKEGPVTAVISGVKDTFQDVKNFKQAVKTGKLGDNSLGRLNDLGMKMGGLLIALFLATQKRSKTESIMQFVGGGAFFASMALWPKLAINLPARIVHGFSIGQKYISAQGDKKDFFLDNQFLPWDAVPKSEMAQNAKRAGIDINSENGEEKIRRKMQKTALQNRTLWMATAGFSTPLMTSLFGNFITPKIKDGVIKHDFKNTKSIVENKGIENYLRYSRAEVLNNRAIEALFNEYKDREFDDNFYMTLSKMLQVLAPEYKTKMTPDGIKLVAGKNGEYVSRGKQLFKDVDDANIMGSFDGLTSETADALRRMAGETVSIDLAKVKQNLKGARAGFGVLNDSQIRDIMDAIGENTDEATIRRVLAEKKINIKKIDEIINASKGVDTSRFLEAVKKYNTDTVGEIRGRAKAFANLLNPIVGQKEESVYTQEYMDTFENLYNVLDLPYSKGDVASLKNIHSDPAKIRQAYIDLFTANANVDDTDKYKEFLETLAVQNEAQTRQKMSSLTKLISKTEAKDKKNVFDELILKAAKHIQKASIKGEATPAMFSEKDSIVDTLLQKENLEQVVPQEMRSDLTDSIVGNANDENSIFGIIQRFCRIQKSNLSSVQATPLICANFERRVQSGEFSDLTEQELEAARALVYSGNISLRNNKDFFRDANAYAKIANRVFDSNAFDVEESVMPGIKEVINRTRFVGEDLEGLNGKISDIIKNNLKARRESGLFDSLSEQQRSVLKNIEETGKIDRKNCVELCEDKNFYSRIMDIVFDKNAYSQQDAEVSGFGNMLESLKALSSDLELRKQKFDGDDNITQIPFKEIKRLQGGSSVEYAQATDFISQTKTYLTSAFNKKHWEHIFIPATIALVVITLAAQHFFGKIDNEYPEKKGGDK